MNQNQLDPKISIIIPVYNGIQTIDQCLSAIRQTEFDNFECIIVDDGSQDDSRKVARRYDVRVTELDNGPHGPAFARNKGAAMARGDILFFVDVDVIIQPDTVGKVVAAFAENPGITALFGSYDEDPMDRSFLSQYKNLLHHYVHQQGRENAATFWSGCGAIRREVFMILGGFDADRYPRPSIEDIELGYRLKTAGYEVMLHKDIQVKHLKHWSLKGLLKTDILDRAIPWAGLIFEQRQLPNDLNVATSQRLSALLLGAMLLHLALNAFANNFLLLPLVAALFLTLAGSWQWYQGPTLFHLNRKAQTVTYLLMGAIFIMAFFGKMPQLLPPLALLLVITIAGHYLSSGSPLVRKIIFSLMMLAIAIVFGLLVVSYPLQLVLPLLALLAILWLLNSRLYRFFIEKRGFAFAFAALPFQLLYYLYSAAAFVVSGGVYLWKAGLKTR